MKRGFSYTHSQTFANGGEPVPRHMLRNPRYMTKKEIYNDSRYKAARAACLARAGNKCEECRRYGRSTDATTAHHMKPVEQYPELAFDASNLRALCEGCHNKEHPEKGGTRGRRH